MDLIVCFFVGFLFSFLGSIPPGTINITTLQYSLSGKKLAAISFAVACAITEYLYAGIAVKFQLYLSSNPGISDNIKIISGIVFLTLGVYNLVKRNSPNQKEQVNENKSAFKKGVLISLTNPLAIPFWLAITIYLQSMSLINLSGHNYLIYVAGISVGTFALLFTVIRLGTRFTSIQNNQFVIYRIPGLVFLGMGIYSFV
ncbi:MAG: LysE family transporter [Cyclobacteriaceae bacterium]